MQEKIRRRLKQSKTIAKKILTSVTVTYIMKLKSELYVTVATGMTFGRNQTLFKKIKKNIELVKYKTNSPPGLVKITDSEKKITIVFN